MENKETQEKVDLWDPMLDQFVLNKVYIEVGSAENETTLDMIQFCYKSLNRIIVSYIRDHKTDATQLTDYEKRVLKDGSTRFYYEALHLISAKRREILKKKGGAKDRINTMRYINSMYLNMLETANRVSRDDRKRQKDDSYSGWLRR